MASPLIKIVSSLTQIVTMQISTNGCQVYSSDVNHTLKTHPGPITVFYESAVHCIAKSLCCNWIIKSPTLWKPDKKDRLDEIAEAVKNSQDDYRGRQCQRSFGLDQVASFEGDVSTERSPKRKGRTNNHVPSHGFSPLNIQNNFNSLINQCVNYAKLWI